MTAALATVDTAAPAPTLSLVEPAKCDQPCTLEQQMYNEHKAWRASVDDEQRPHPDWVRVLEWERNGPNDSDWYSIVLHRPSGKLIQVESGTTRFANALHVFHGFFSRATDADVDTARKAWAVMSARFLCGMDRQECEEPRPYLFKQGGVEVVTLRKCNVEVRTTEPCRKCEGTGKYSGRRPGPCFACDGVGLKLVKKARKDDAGEETAEKVKPTKLKIAEGTRAVTLAPSEAWGKFYSGGYNKPDRSNSRVLCRLEFGEVVFISLEALRLAREPIAYEDKLQETTAWSLRFGVGDERWAAPFGVRVF